MTEEQINLFERQAQKLVNRLYSHAYVDKVHIEIRILNGEMVFVPTYFIEKGSALHTILIIDTHNAKKMLNEKLIKILDYLGVNVSVREYLTYYRV